jgi:VWFA-related protein
VTRVADLTVRRFACVVAAAAWFTYPAAAGQAPTATSQAPSAAGQAPPAAVFKAGVDLVRLDVDVTDMAGRPIRDLRPEEIEVLEEGKRRPVLLFQHFEEPVAPVEELASRTAAGEVSTNQGAPRGHLYVLIFDQSHITPGNEQRARRAAEDFLRAHLRAGDRAAVYAIPGPGPQVEFTNDVPRIIQQLSSVGGRLERSGLSGIGSMHVFEAYQIVRGNDDVLERVAAGFSQAGSNADVLTDVPKADDSSSRRMVIQETARAIVTHEDQSARQFLLILSDIMRRLSAIEGRKSVMLFSEGFFIDNVSREMIQAAAAAAQSQSIVYSIDLNRRGVTGSQLGPLGSIVSAEIQSRMEPLAALSLETNGILFNNAADWLPSALRIAADSHHYYILGFEPPAGGKETGGYRRVKVIVHRSGARVSSRTGYATGAAPKLDRRRAIDAALAAPFPHQGLPIEYTTYVLGAGDIAGSAKVLLSASAELPLGADASTEKADIVFAVKRVRDNAIISSGTDTIPLPTVAPRGRATGVGPYQIQFEAPPGDYIMRVVVREPAGSVGSADRRFRVPALPGPAAGATDLVLATSGQKLPVRARAYTSEPLTGLSELVARNPQQLANVRARIELTGQGQDAPALTTYAELGAIVPTSAGATRSATAVLPLDAVAPGHYVARLIVQGGGEAAETLTREVDVLAGPPPLDAAFTKEPSIPDVVLGGVVARECLQRLAAAPELRGSAALSLAYSGRWNEADAALGTLDGAARPELHLLKGFALFALGNYAKSIDELSSVLETDPKTPPVAFVLGWVYAAAGRDRDAIGSWRNATVLDPALVPAYLALADAYLRLAQPALAVQVLRAGLVARPASPELQDKLSKITAS